MTKRKRNDSQANKTPVKKFKTTSPIIESSLLIEKANTSFSEALYIDSSMDEEAQSKFYLEKMENALTYIFDALTVLEQVPSDDVIEFQKFKCQLIQWEIQSNFADETIDEKIDGINTIIKLITNKIEHSKNDLELAIASQKLQVFKTLLANYGTVADAELTKAQCIERGMYYNNFSNYLINTIDAFNRKKTLDHHGARILINTAEQYLKAEHYYNLGKDTLSAKNAKQQYLICKKTLGNYYYDRGIESSNDLVNQVKECIEKKNFTFEKAKEFEELLGFLEYDFQFSIIQYIDAQILEETYTPEEQILDPIYGYEQLAIYYCAMAKDHKNLSLPNKALEAATATLEKIVLLATNLENDDDDQTILKAKLNLLDCYLQQFFTADKKIESVLSSIKQDELSKLAKKDNQLVRVYHRAQTHLTDLGEINNLLDGLNYSADHSEPLTEDSEKLPVLLQDISEMDIKAVEKQLSDKAPELDDELEITFETIGHEEPAIVTNIIKLQQCLKQVAPSLEEIREILSKINEEELAQLGDEGFLMTYLDASQLATLDEPSLSESPSTMHAPIDVNISTPKHKIPLHGGNEISVGENTFKLIAELKTYRSLATPLTEKNVSDIFKLFADYYIHQVINKRLIPVENKNIFDHVFYLLELSFKFAKNHATMSAFENFMKYIEMNSPSSLVTYREKEHELYQRYNSGIIGNRTEATLALRTFFDKRVYGLFGLNNNTPVKTKTVNTLLKEVIEKSQANERSNLIYPVISL